MERGESRRANQREHEKKNPGVIKQKEELNEKKRARVGDRGGEVRGTGECSAVGAAVV